MWIGCDLSRGLGVESSICWELLIYYFLISVHICPDHTISALLIRFAFIHIKFGA